MNRLLYVLTIIILMLICQISYAETVYIESKSGSLGSGWLFGSIKDGKCWIVTPAHVVTSKETGALEPFKYYDGSDVTGQSATPFRLAADQKPTTRADKEANDLAFARVRSGRPDGSCTSRLGLPSHAYQYMLQKQKGFYVGYRFKTSSGTFGVNQTHRGVDAYGGAALDFTATDQLSTSLLRQGLSGSAVLAEFDGKVQPVALVTSLDQKNGIIKALRFDLIKEKFAKGPLPGDLPLRSNAQDGYIDFDIVRASYLPIEGDTGPESLQENNSCWRAAARGGERTVELVLAVRKREINASAIEIMQSDACGGTAVKFWIDQHTTGESEWQHVASGITENSGNVSIRVNGAGMREYRIKFQAAKPVHIAKLRMR